MCSFLRSQGDRSRRSMDLLIALLWRWRKHWRVHQRLCLSRKGIQGSPNNHTPLWNCCGMSTPTPVVMGKDYLQRFSTKRHGQEVHGDDETSSYDVNANVNSTIECCDKSREVAVNAHEMKFSMLLDENRYPGWSIYQGGTHCDDPCFP